MGIAYLIYDLPDDHLSVGSSQLLQMGEAEHLRSRIAQQFCQWLVGIVVSQIKKCGAVCASGVSIEDHHSHEVCQDILADVLVTHADK